MPERKKKSPTPIRRSAEYVPVTLSRPTFVKLVQLMAVRDMANSLAQNATAQFTQEFVSVCNTLGIDPDLPYTLDIPTRKLLLSEDQPAQINAPEESDEEDAS